MKKLSLLFVALFLFVGGIIFLANKPQNIAQACSTTKYEVDADEDKTDHLTLADSGGKVDVVFNVTNGVTPEHNHRNQVVVTAGSGYEIVNVQYELEHYSGIGWTTVAGVNPTTTITLAGVDDDSWIDEVEVKLQVPCVTPTPTTVTPTATPTQTPPNGGGSVGPGDGLGCSTHDCSGNKVGGPASQPVQAVLGASTMAGTGTFENAVMSLMLIAGMVVLSLGGLSYAKEKKSL